MTNIRVDITESIATLTIDRPAVKNALDRETVGECHRALDTLEQSPDVGVLVITGAGESSFVSGADINDMRGRTGADGLAAISSSLFARVERFPAADDCRDQRLRARRWLRAGAGLRHPCGRRLGEVRSARARPRHHPAAGATQRLPRVVGQGWARHLILTGEIIDAKQALEIGLVTAIMPASQLQVRARELAKRILKQGPLAARLAKLALNASARVDLDSGLLIETLAQAICYESEDKQEGTSRVPREEKAEILRAVMLTFGARDSAFGRARRSGLGLARSLKAAGRSQRITIRPCRFVLRSSS